MRFNNLMKFIIIYLLLLHTNSVLLSQNVKERIGIGLYGSMVKMVGGDIDRSTIEQWAGLQINYGLTPSMSVNASAALGWVYPKNPDGSHFTSTGKYKTNLLPATFNVNYNLNPDSKLRPYIALGLGVTYWDIRKLDNEVTTFSQGVSLKGAEYDFSLIGGFGFEYFLSRDYLFNIIFKYHRLIKGNDDTIGYGDDGNDAIAELRFGFSYYFGGFQDRDKDGIEDQYDLDPLNKEDFDGFADEDGAPDVDNDNDGIPDSKDGAPNNPEDIDGFMDDDGIPDLDNDNDKIPDTKDKCPNIPEDFDGFEDSDGCPEIDNDNDTIPDSLDKCPDLPENINGYLDKDGCPDEKPRQAIIEKGKKMILRGVTFESGSAELTPYSFSSLNDVVQTLKDFPKIAIEIHGYTDNIGNFNSNQQLSERRANSVKEYLTKNGVNPDRIRAVGYGELHPIANNNTGEGRALNRRIEFVRTK